MPDEEEEELDDEELDELELDEDEALLESGAIFGALPLPQAPNKNKESIKIIFCISAPIYKKIPGKKLAGDRRF